MYILGYFLNGVARVIDMGLFFLMILVFGRAIISWVQASPYNPIVQFLYTTTEPILRPIRRRLPPTGGIDLSPLIVLMLVVFLRAFLVMSLLRIAANLIR